MKKTKIVCTLGPASNDDKIIGKMISSGMDVARINMSHGTQDSLQTIIDAVKRVRENASKPIAIMADTKGPEIRVGCFKYGLISLKNNSLFTLTTRNIIGNESIVSLKYKKLIDDVSVGTKIYANNGMLVLKVKEKTKTDLICKVLFGGTLSNNKGLNVPNVQIKTKFLSDEDKNDLLFAIKNDVEYVSASFVSKKQDVLALREFLNENGGDSIKIIAKIENKAGVKNISSILNVSDGVMVARGDMGVEMPPQKLPPIQKMMIASAIKAGKIVIVATEMLESMTTAIRPTRSEVNDVACAVFDGATATMLSGETAVGKHPVKVVKMMNDIITESEKHINYKKAFESLRKNTLSVADSVAKNASKNSEDLKAKAIITFTQTGGTANLIARNRPSARILALTNNRKTRNALALEWNTTAYIVESINNENKMIETAKNICNRLDFVKKDDNIIITTGTPNVTKATNLIKIITI